MRRWHTSAWISLFCVWTSQVSAQSVVIRWTPGVDSETAEVVTRLHGELVAMGIEVAVDREAGSTAGPDGPSHDLPSRPDAVMEVTSQQEQLSVQIWARAEAGDLVPWNELVESSQTANASEKVAIRAAEALRSRFVQDDFRPSNPDVGAPAQPAVRPVEAAGGGEIPVVSTPEDVSLRPRFALGGALMAATRGTTPALMPLARLEWPIVPGLVPQVTLAGLGTRSEVTTTNGGAEVSWNYAVLGVSYYAAKWGTVEPFIGMSTGVLLGTVQGQAQEPFDAHVSTEVFWLTEASLGILIAVSPTYFVTAAGHTHVTQPSMAIHVADEVAAVSGRPNWLATLTLGARL